jgi:ArsR family transcriptional regulator
VEAKQVVGALSALAQESRLEVFRLLVRRGLRGLPAGDIAARLSIPAPTLSFHLAQLARAGLVRSRREGRSIIYAADYGGMQELMDFLSANCCQEDPTACRPLRPSARRAERARKRSDDGAEQGNGRRA